MPERFNLGGDESRPVIQSLKKPQGLSSKEASPVRRSPDKFNRDERRRASVEKNQIFVDNLKDVFEDEERIKFSKKIPFHKAVKALHEELLDLDLGLDY